MRVPLRRVRGWWEPESRVHDPTRSHQRWCRFMQGAALVHGDVALFRDHRNNGQVRVLIGPIRGHGYSVRARNDAKQPTFLVSRIHGDADHGPRALVRMSTEIAVTVPGHIRDPFHDAQWLHQGFDAVPLDRRLRQFIGTRHGLSDRRPGIAGEDPGGRRRVLHEMLKPDACAHTAVDRGPPRLTIPLLVAGEGGVDFLTDPGHVAGLKPAPEVQEAGFTEEVCDVLAGVVRCEGLLKVKAVAIAPNEPYALFEDRPSLKKCEPCRVPRGQVLG